MNIRLNHQSIRFRLSEDEFLKLCSEEIVTEEVQLSEKSLFKYSVQSISNSQNSGMQLLVEGKETYLQVPHEQLVELSTTLPSKEGLSSEMIVGDSRVLKVFLEVDIRKIKQERLL